jgi:transposase
MGRPILKVKGYQSEEIKALIKSNPDYQIGIMLLAIYQVAKGVSSRKLEELYNTSFKQITNWVHRFEESGVEGLKDKGGRGRKPGLDEEQLDRIRELLTNESPTSYGYNTETWTGPLLLNWIEANMGISYKKAQVYNILHKLGLSHKKAKATYPETDLNAQEAFKEGLKKTPRKP